MTESSPEITGQAATIIEVQIILPASSVTKLPTGGLMVDCSCCSSKFHMNCIRLPRKRCIHYKLHLHTRPQLSQLPKWSADHSESRSLSLSPSIELSLELSLSLSLSLELWSP